MDSGKLGEYKKYMSSLYDFMEKEGYTSKPKPEVILNEKKQGDGPFIQTGFYNPEERSVTLFVEGRHMKDILRSLAHELIHHKQNMDGRLGEGAYSGTEITKDNKLQKLEAEAYVKGNMVFRSWTEIMKKK